MSAAPPASRFAIVGSGNSTGVPWLYCTLNPAVCCSVCAECARNPDSRNVRNNVSALLQFAHPDGRMRNILIDCGKTFRSTVLRQFPRLGVSRLDAVILTHPHADAMNGLDDLRDVSPDTPLPVFVSEVCFERIAASYTYLVKGAPIPGLFIAQLDWRIIRPFEPFEVAGLVVTPLPVEHGEPGPMLAFEFCHITAAAAAAAAAAATVATATESSEAAHPASSRVVYISDIAALPLDTRQHLKSGPPIDLLVLDALSYRSYPTHFSLKQAVACALDLNARSSVLVGMNHRVDYAVEQPKLAAFGRRHGVDMQLAYDGWSTEVSLRQEGTLAAASEALAAANAEAMRLWATGAVRCATTADAAVRAGSGSAAPLTRPSPAAGAAGTALPSERAFEGAPSSFASPLPEAAEAGGTAASRPGSIARRPQRVSTKTDDDFDALAAAADAGAFPGWVRPAALPALRPLVTGNTAGDCCSAAAAAPAAAAVASDTPGREGAPTHVACAGSMAAAMGHHFSWPLVRGRPPAVTYADANLPEWDEEAAGPGALDTVAPVKRGAPPP